MAGSAPPATKDAKQPAMPPQVFRVGVYDTESNDYDQTVTMTTATVNFPNEIVEPNGWNRGFWFLFELVTAGNSANVAYNPDAPFNLVFKITLKDVGNREIFGPLTGYEWLQVMKFGGYHEVGDPRGDITFSAITGTGATGGSVTMVMYLPLELVARDALGDVENKSASSAFKVEIVLAASTDVYSTSPTTLGTCRLRIALDGYTEPDDMDSFGRPLSQAPPAQGTLQYWVSENADMSAGNAVYLIQNGLGYSLRNLIFTLTKSTVRSTGDADWPDPVTLSFGKVQLFSRYKTLWISKFAKDFGLTNTNTDAAGGRELGVFPYYFTKDFGLKPGAELRNAYLATKPGNVLKWSGTVGGTGTHNLKTLVNYVVPPSNDPARVRAGQ